MRLHQQILCELREIPEAGLSQHFEISADALCHQLLSGAFTYATGTLDTR